MKRLLAVAMFLVLGATATVTASPAEAAIDDFPTPCPQMTDSIYRLYTAYFLREPDPGGWDYWLNTYGTGYNTNLEVISDSFANSQEFQIRYGSLSNEQFVRLVYNNVLGREPDPVGLSHWVTALNNGYSRGAVMIAFSESEEYVLKTNSFPSQAGYLMWYDRHLQFDCGTGFHSSLNARQLISVPSDIPSPHVDILVWNTTDQTRKLTARFLYAANGGAIPIYDEVLLNPGEYLHLYNIPVPDTVHEIRLSKDNTNDPQMAWSVNFYDHPHSTDRPGWEGFNWLTLPGQSPLQRQAASANAVGTAAP